jgi:Zn-dependent protease with chaperone function
MVLAVTLLGVALVVAVTASATVCGSGLFLAAFTIFSFYIGRSHHQELMRHARGVNPQESPRLAEMVRHSQERLRPGEVEVYIAPSRQLNAYTFGLESPKVVVLFSGLFQVMDEDELQFIIGHEMGHVALGHTWLNSLVGGLAGIPASWSAGALLAIAFLWWNRMCEYSADRAGLLTCGKPEKAVSALVKLVAGERGGSEHAMELAYRQIDAEDDSLLGSLGETLGSHPLIIKRIQELRRYAASSAYPRHQKT